MIRFFLIITAAFAVLFAIQGFPGFNTKTDMYMSMVSSCKKVHYIYLNGMESMGYVISCAFCSLLRWEECLGVFHENHTVWVRRFLCNMLFTAVYNLSIMAVMLTGNVLCNPDGPGIFPVNT